MSSVLQAKKEGARKKEKVKDTASSGGWFGWLGGSKKSAVLEEKTIGKHLEFYNVIIILVSLIM